MQKNLNAKLGESYTSNSQKVRVMSETWTEKNIFCPNCGGVLDNLENNKKVSDFLCEKCRENYEQKASKNKFKNKVLSSEYYTLIKRLKAEDKPHFFFLHYEKDVLRINDFFLCPNIFLCLTLLKKEKHFLKRLKGLVGLGLIFYLIKFQIQEKFII